MNTRSARNSKTTAKVTTTPKASKPSNSKPPKKYSAIDLDDDELNESSETDPYAASESDWSGEHSLNNSAKKKSRKKSWTKSVKDDSDSDSDSSVVSVPEVTVKKKRKFNSSKKITMSETKPSVAAPSPAPLDNEKIKGFPQNKTIVIKNESKVCKPIVDFSDLVKYHTPKWLRNETIEELRPREYCVSGADLSCHVSVDKWTPRKYHLNGTVPKTMVIHDFKDNYLEDRYVDGSTDPCYTFYRWSSVDVFVYFSHKLITIPPIGWINAAHRNGVKILGTIMTEFSEGKKIMDEILQTDETADIFLKTVMKVTEKFRLDGWLVNIEHDITPVCEKFIKLLYALRERLHTKNPDSTLIWYDSLLSCGKMRWCNGVNRQNRRWFDLCDGILLNYAWDRASLQTTLDVVAHRTLDVYVGVDVFSRNCVGGMQCAESAAIIREFGLSLGLFAIGWTYETLHASPSDFQEKFEARDGLMWHRLKPHLYENVVLHEFVTFFERGYAKDYYNMNTQQMHLNAHPFAGEWEERVDAKDKNIANQNNGEMLPKVAQLCITSEHVCRCVELSTDQAIDRGSSYFISNLNVQAFSKNLMRLFTCYYNVTKPTAVFFVIKDTAIKPKFYYYNFVLKCQRVNHSYFQLVLNPLCNSGINDDVMDKSNEWVDAIVNVSEMEKLIGHKVDLKKLNLDEWKLSAYKLPIVNFKILEIGVYLESEAQMHLGGVGVIDCASN